MRQAVLPGLLLVLASYSACREVRLSEAEAIARQGTLERHSWRMGGLPVLGFERSGPQGQVLVVYIEGDGRAWVNPWQPSSDPTPADPIALRLAAIDPSRPLLYLARPCQYVFVPSCDSRFWTSERLSPAVVQGFQQVIDDARRGAKSDRIALVGYSGGGALATLIAEQRHDVAWLITVAANLDLAAWVRSIKIEAMSGSLDPAMGAEKVRRLPQVHFAGANDLVVPPIVLYNFFAQLSPAPAARIIVLPGFDHECCWAAAWPRLLELSGMRP